MGFCFDDNFSDVKPVGKSNIFLNGIYADKNTPNHIFIIKNDIFCECFINSTYEKFVSIGKMIRYSYNSFIVKSTPFDCNHYDDYCDFIAKHIKHIDFSSAYHSEIYIYAEQNCFVYGKSSVGSTSEQRIKNFVQRATELTYQNLTRNVYRKVSDDFPNYKKYIIQHKLYKY